MKRYNDSDTPSNVALAQTIMPWALCPSDPYPSLDNEGFGRTDYFATVYTDIQSNPLAAYPPIRENAAGTTNERRNGALAVPECPIAAITDGVSTTMLCIEDTGRTDMAGGYGGASGTLGALSKYSYAASGPDGAAETNPDGTSLTVVDSTTPCVASGANGAAPCHGVWRWADMDACGSGVSGQGASDAVSRAKFINGNAVPVGGTALCPWSANNCGVNDEPFSFHPGGCNSVFCDGSVHFLSDTLDGRTLRYMITRDEGIPITQKVNTSSTAAASASASTMVAPDNPLGK
jgi:prepilin-type processing-associated H-X9-DG protein